MNRDAHRSEEDFEKLFAQREGHADAEALEAGLSEDSASTGGFDATFVPETPMFGKKERDFVFAAVLLQESHLNHRELSNVTSDWTIHGDESLADHLLNKGVISTALRDDLELRADSRIQQATERATNCDGVAFLEELDPSGRVSRLLGLTTIPRRESSDQERTVSTRYKILRKLGQGGLGTVWLARDENLRRLVAVKEIVRTASDSPSVLRRFRREAEITGRLEHPSIVPVHQFGEDATSGRAFYTMRFVGKGTLEDAISEYHERRVAGDRDPMHLHHLLTSFVSICQAVAYAHSRDVVHRDLKPENVALDNFGQVIVLDWGLAKLLGEAELAESYEEAEFIDNPGFDKTMDGQVLGTPMYMAPEQAAGRIDEIDERTDVYGLGAILFAILTSYAPHEKSHESMSSTSKVTELFRAIVSNPTPKASSLNPDVAPELDAVCAKAIARKRYARYETASALAEDLQRWMAGEPVAAYQEPWHRRARRWIATHPRLSQVVGVLLIVALVAATTFSMNARQNRMAAQIAQFESLNSEGRELETALRSAAIDLAKNARFMAGLPPIQGVIDARSGAQTDDEDVWHARLQTIPDNSNKHGNAGIGEFSNPD